MFVIALVSKFKSYKLLNRQFVVEASPLQIVHISKHHSHKNPTALRILPSNLSRLPRDKPVVTAHKNKYVHTGGRKSSKAIQVRIYLRSFFYTVITPRPDFSTHTNPARNSSNQATTAQHTHMYRYLARGTRAGRAFKEEWWNGIEQEVGESVLAGAKATSVNLFGSRRTFTRERFLPFLNEESKDKALKRSTVQGIILNIASLQNFV